MEAKEYEDWYRWFTEMLSRKSDDAEKNAIRHLVGHMLSEAVIAERKRIGEWLSKNTRVHFNANPNDDKAIFTLDLKSVNSAIGSLKAGKPVG